MTRTRARTEFVSKFLSGVSFSRRFARFVFVTTAVTAMRRRARLVRALASRVATRAARGTSLEGNVRRRRARGAKIENFVSRRLSVPRSRRARPREAGDRVHALDVRLNDRPRAVVASHAVLAGSHAAVVPVPEERAGEVAVRGGRLSTRAMGSV